CARGGWLLRYYFDYW
nr:immunoglobulin heavy chain junction region [Mus musculus]